VKSEHDFYERVVRDTLDSIVSAGVRDSVVTEALTLAGEIHVPRRAREFRAFTRGPLRETLERALGQELGRSVVAELIRLSESGKASSAPPRGGGPKRSSNSVSTVPPAAVRAQRVGNAPTIPARPRREEPLEAPDSARPRAPISNDYPAGVARAFGMLSSNPVGGAARKLPIVFVATRDAELVRRFAAWLDPRASVVRVMRLAELLVHVEDAGDRRMVVVVDGNGSTLRVESLAAVSEEMPETSNVILWGGTRELTARLSDFFPRVSEWLVCSDQVPLAEVIDRCAEIVG
jgi:hypothetical protein